MPTIALDSNGQHVAIADNSVNGAGEGDASAFAEYRRLLHKSADALGPFWHKTMPRIGMSGLSGAMTFAHVGLNIRRMGKADMREFLRIASLPARDLMDEFFTNDLLKAALCWDGLIGGKMAPRSPNSAILVMLYRMAEASRGQHAVPEGGVQGLVDSLGEAARGHGAEIRCSARVERIVVDGDENGLRTTGVELADGEQISAPLVVSGADPKRTFFDLVGVQHLDIGFTNRIRRLRCDGYVGKLHLALDGVPEFTGVDSSKAARLIIAPTMDAIEFAFDNAKYGELPDEPVLEIALSDRPGDGKHVLSAHVMYVPRELKGGWTDAAREDIATRTVETIAKYAPGIRERILGSEFLTPADLEQRYNVTGGHWHHTEIAMDQMLMMRPTYGAAQYATPIPGLYLCGAGSHPGGDLTGAAGHNAAHEILQ